MHKNRIPPMQQPSPRPKTITLKVTKDQIDGLKARQAQIDAAVARLSDFASGIVAGHGYDVVEVIAFDDEKLTVTIVAPQKRAAK